MTQSPFSKKLSIILDIQIYKFMGFNASLIVKIKTSLFISKCIYQSAGAWRRHFLWGVEANLSSILLSILDC